MRKVTLLILGSIGLLGFLSCSWFGAVVFVLVLPFFMTTLLKQLTGEEDYNNSEEEEDCNNWNEEEYYNKSLEEREEYIRKELDYIKAEREFLSYYKDDEATVIKHAWSELWEREGRLRELVKEWRRDKEHENKIESPL